MGELSATRRSLFWGLVMVLFFCGADSLKAQATDNAWTNAVSGNWEGPYWSLGALPGTNQDIYITNAGWKAVAIGPNTVQNYPQTLKVGSITLSSPTNSFNVLLLNYAGYQTPITAGEITLNSNTVMTTLASTLNVNNGDSGQPSLEVGGTVNQSEFSDVSVVVLGLGQIGPGIYNLTNGTLNVRGMDPIVGYLGGAFPGVFNQFGGSNEISGGGLELDSGGTYNLYDGDFNGEVILNSGGFVQTGGLLSGALIFRNGGYGLYGGICSPGNLQVPTLDPYLSEITGGFYQAGGTNLCQSLMVSGVNAPASQTRSGSYTLTNGSLFVSGCVSINGIATLNQSGGVQTNSAMELNGQSDGYDFEEGTFNLSGGLALTGGLNVNAGIYNQSGGTNQISGELYFSGEQFLIYPGQDEPAGQFTLAGGLLTCSNATIVSEVGGVFTQSGGSLHVSNDLNIYGGFYRFTLGGGQLIAPVITLSNGGTFNHTGGVLVNSGLVTLANGAWIARTGETDLGTLVLGVGTTNPVSSLTFPSGPATVRFGDSSTMIWSNQATLSIESWDGSVAGGGPQQLFFGNNSQALTAQQLSQIQFHNPAGVSGTWPANILPTGEIVPMVALPPVIGASGLANGKFTLVVSGETGFVYGIVVSTDLLHWSLWTNQNNAGGTMTFVDAAATNFPHRFYRAFVQP